MGLVGPGNRQVEVNRRFAEKKRPHKGSLVTYSSVGGDLLCLLKGSVTSSDRIWQHDINFVFGEGLLFFSFQSFLGGHVAFGVCWGRRTIYFSCPFLQLVPFLHDFFNC